jgi:diguanylate cyclase (GGDEF)-like protein
VSQQPNQMQQGDTPSFQVLAAQQEIDSLNELAWKLRIGQKERAYEICVRAEVLARTGIFAQEPYRLGLAACQATMAIINADCGRPDQAITQCIEALSILNNLPPTPALIDVWVAMSWIHIYLGSFPVALDYALKALNLARELKDRHREAWAMDAAASTYGVSADPDSSIPMHSQAALIFSEIGDVEGQARTLNNMACTLLESGQLDQALEASLKSLDLARQTGMKMETVIFACTACDILIAKGDYQQAERYILSGVEGGGETGNLLATFSYFLGLGRLYLVQGRLDEADASLKAALTIGEVNEMANDQAECHRLLAEVAERRGQLAEALIQYKQYHQLKETTTGEETARRLAILKVAHQSESAMRDAEIYRLRNIELQHEIEERKRMESLLHNMAMLDPLTNLYNRRQFYSLAKSEIERAKRYGHALSVLMIDLDHFKKINDQYGHLAGDQVLITVAQTIKAGLRENDVVGRYGGEEFVALLPETTADQAYEVSERIRRAVSETRFETSTGTASVTMSIGVADWSAEMANTGSDLDLLLGRADRALYCAKDHGRNITYQLNDGDSNPQ